MKQPQRWNDWMLLLAMLCMILAPLWSLLMIFGIERPLFRELQASHIPYGNGGPGHFFSYGMAKMVRMIGSLGILIFGMIFALIGGINVPQKATGTQALRYLTWMMSIFSLLGILACLRYL